MKNDNEPYGSIIPQVVLEAALAGKEVSRNVKKRLFEADTRLNTEVGESLGEEKQIKSKTKRSASKQSSLDAFFTMPSSSIHWEPLHKQLSTKKSIKFVRKRIAIDPPEFQRAGKISSVAAEESSDENDICEGEQLRLEESVSMAGKRSTKQYVVKDREGKEEKDLVQQIPTLTTTFGKKENGVEAYSKSPCNVSLDETASESTSSATREIVELDCAHGTPDCASLEDVEILHKVHISPTSSPNKRLGHSTPRPRSLSMRKNYARVAKTTPRRKIPHQRSFSPLHFVLDDEEFNIPKAPVIRRRRLSGEMSVFDFSASGEEVEAVVVCSQQRCPASMSCSLAAEVHKMRPTESSPTSVVDDTESDASVELYDTATVPSTPISDCFADDRVKEKSSVFVSHSANTETKSFESKGACEEETLSFRIDSVPHHDVSVEDVNDEQGSLMNTPSKYIGDVVMLKKDYVIPSKSTSSSTLLYSPRKMELSNSQRLKMILAKTLNKIECFPNLHRLLPDSDYCSFQISSISKDKPPVTSPQTCEDTDLNFANPVEFVRLPWSTANIVSGFHHYIIIDRALRALVHDGAHCIEAVIVTLRECAPWLKSYDGLLGFMECLSTSEEREILDVMAGIAKLAVNAKFILTSPVPVLRANRSASVTLSQEQCACLLAHAFFCTYRRERLSFNRINMASIFDGRNPMCHVKLRFILHYFSIVLKKMPTGCVSFRREVLSPNEIPNWEEDQTLIPLMAISSDTSIEDSHGCLQVDFANEYIGGGVLNWGAVQEEIRFLICPEMIVSCLLCEKMGPLEVIHIVGAQRFSSYFGYGETLRWAPYEDFGSEPRDDFCRVKCDVVAMDATLFKSSSRRNQYDRLNIDRELNKAYTAFMSTQREPSPIATGNWGCGVFGGDKELKIIIQMMAAARAGRDMIYCTFGSPSFEYCANEQYEKMVQKKARVGTLYKALTSYQRERERNPRLSVFDHVYAVLSEIACTAS